jgi:hypothetical protein
MALGTRIVSGVRREASSRYIGRAIQHLSLSGIGSFTGCGSHPVMMNRPGFGGGRVLPAPAGSGGCSHGSTRYPS